MIRPRRRPALAAMTVAVLAAACGDPPAHVRLVPVGGACGRPTGANAVRVTAFAADGEHSRSLGIDEAIAISDFPADTEQIGVEVLVGGGAVGAAGKSAPLAFDALADGAAIPILMGPPDALCELPGMTAPRAQPLVARAGGGVLVVGGIGPSGPLSTAEYYDPAAEAFVPVEVPPALVDPQGFTGGALATLPDGRVALIGGPQHAFIVFDPAARAFVTDPTLIEHRAFHAAMAIGGDEVLIAGGCFEVEALACAGLRRLGILRYSLARLSLPEASGALADGPRISATLFDLGIQLDGRRRFLLAGGTGAAGGTGVADHADRFALDGGNAEIVPGAQTQAAALDGGAVITAFDAGAPVSQDTHLAAVIAPGVAEARPVAAAPDLPDVRLIALEDGRIVGFGGGATGQVLIYDPTHDAWRAEHAGPVDRSIPLTAPSLARLADGAVVVLGGELSPRAWLYRPPLTGPASGSVTVAPSETATGVLTAPDPAAVTRVASPPAWHLATPAGAEMARALVGGPRTAVGSVRAIVHVVSGGVALIAQQTGPGQAIVAELAPDSPPRLVQLEAGAEHVVCRGPGTVAAFDPAAPVTLRLAIAGQGARLSIDEREILACDLAATGRGAWGIASLGAGAELTVESVTVARPRPAT